MFQVIHHVTGLADCDDLKELSKTLIPSSENPRVERFRSEERNRIIQWGETSNPGDRMYYGLVTVIRLSGVTGSLTV